MRIEDVVCKEEIHLSQYVTSNTDKLMQTVKNILKKKSGSWESAERLMKWKEKPMDGQYLREMEEQARNSVMALATMRCTETRNWESYNSCSGAGSPHQL